MKSTLPLVLCSFTLSGCLTVNVPEKEHTNSEQEQIEEPNAQAPNSPDDNSNPDAPNNQNDVPDPIMNSAPTISGTPNTTVEINLAYTFQPIALDNDKDNLSFNINNLPVWASFNNQTGELFGTPDSVNSYKSIVISVTDGTHTTLLEAFDINVALPTPFEVTINWLAPTEDENNQALTEFGGYKVYYGNFQGSEDQSITITDPNKSQANITNLSAGDYFFTMVALSTSGAESDKSNEFYFQVGL